MNRIIKFRGKSVETGEWVYGDLIHRTGIPSTVSPVQIDDTGVDPATVGQFTGLRDKNGNEIYEGDITDRGDGRTLEVYYCERQAVFLARNKWGNTANLDTYNWKIVGSIHDNPELISNTEKNNQ